MFDVTTGWRLPTDFSLKNYKGLLSVDLIDDSSGSRLLSYWRSKVHYQNAASGFRTGTGIPTTSAVACGALTEVYASKPKWWHITSIRDLILAVAGVAGAILGIRDFGSTVYYAFLAAPDIVVANPSLEPLNVLEGSMIEVPLSLVNDSKTSVEPRCDPCELQLKGGSNGFRLNISTGRIPAIGADKSSDLKLIREALRADTNDPAFDTYELTGKVQATAGWLRGTKRFDIPKRDVLVWPVLSWTGPGFNEVKGSFAVFTSRVFAGRKKDTASVTLSLDGADGVDLVGVKDYPQARPLRSDDGTSDVLTWTAGPLEAFRTDAVFHFNLRSTKPKTEAEWRGYEKRLTLTLE